MTRDERLVFCKTCQNKSFNPESGVVCGLTGKEPDFNPRCPDYKQVIEDDMKPPKKGPKSKTLLVVTTILIIAAGSVFGYLKWKEQKELEALEALYNQFSEDQYMEFARTLESEFKNGYYSSVDQRVDQEYLRTLILNSIYTDATAEEMFERDIYRPGKYIRRSSRCSKPQIDFVRFYRKGVVPHIIYRTFCERQLNYYDFTLGISGGELVIQDMFSYGSGQSFTEDIDIVINEVGGIAKDEKVLKWSKPYRRMVNRYQRIHMALGEGDYMSAEELLAEVPEQFHKYPSYYNMKVRIASFNDTNLFVSAVQDLVRDFPDMEGVAAYHGVHRYTEDGDTTLGLKAIETLREFVGYDPVLDIYEGHMRRRAVDMEGATRAYEKAQSSLTDSPIANWYVLEMALNMNDYKKAARLFKEMNDKGMYNTRQWSMKLYPYRDFMQSSEFLTEYLNAR